MSEHENKPHDRRACPECRAAAARALASADQAREQNAQNLKNLLALVDVIGHECLHEMHLEYLAKREAFKASPDPIGSTNTLMRARQVLEVNLLGFAISTLSIADAERFHAAVCGHEDAGESP